MPYAASALLPANTALLPANTGIETKNRGHVWPRFFCSASRLPHCFSFLVFTAAFVHGVSAPIPRFIPFEVAGCRAMGSSLSGVWYRAMIAVVRIIPVVYMTMKASGTMEPRTGPDENTAGKPFRTVIPIGSAAIGRVVKVAVWTYRGDSDGDSDLGLGCGGGRKTKANSNCYYRKIFKSSHSFTSCT